MRITAAQIAAIMPHAKRGAEFVGPLNAAMALVGIDTPLRAAMFLAQIAHESSEMNRLAENLNYSAKRLREVFPKHFTAASAENYERKPARTANRVYANRLGNGDEASGDGWRYRGRGLIQVTGKSSYADCGKVLKVDLLTDPAMLETPEFAAQSAAWFWRKAKLNAPADKGDLKTCTRKINGGLNGLDTRRVYYERALGVLDV